MKNQPEINLWIAVLSRAILDLDLPDESVKVLAWLKSQEEGPGSFIFVSDILNQEPRALRQRIVRWHERKAQSFQQAA